MELFFGIWTVCEKGTDSHFQRSLALADQKTASLSIFNAIWSPNRFCHLPDAPLSTGTAQDDHSFSLYNRGLSFIYHLLTGAPHRKPIFLLFKQAARPLSLPELPFHKTNEPPFVHRSTPSQPKTLFFSFGRLLPLLSNLRSAHELSHYSQGRPSLEKKAAQILSVGRFSSQPHF
jgi:hypothetical protein